MAHSDSAHVFMLAVPGLLLFLVCSFIWIVQKIPAIFVCLWSEIICFSVTTWTWRCLVWWHCLQAVFSYLTKQVYIIHIFLLVWVLICLAWVAIARIFSHSSQLICFSSPPPLPPPTFLFPHQFLLFCLWLLQLFACLTALSSVEIIIVHIGRYPD